MQWKNDRAKGHEEIVNTGLRAFPANTSNNTLVVNSADSPGVLIKDPDSYENSDLRERIDDGSQVVKGQDIAICEAYPNNFAITATNLWAPSNGNPSYGSLFYTTNGGESYTRSRGYDRDWGKSLVGTSVKDPANIVVVHGNQIHFSKDRGASFTAATHPSLSNVVENNVFIAHDPFAKDLVLNQVFYLYDRSNGHVIKSLNSGKDWFKTAANLPTDTNSFTKSSLQAAPDRAGHLWFNSPKKGLYYSENQGDEWIKLSNVATAEVMTLGKSKTADGYPTVYFIGKLTGDSSSSLYRSFDKGQNWTKVTGPESQFILSSPRCMAGDKEEYGKVYVGVSGLGIWQAELENQEAEEETQEEMQEEMAEETEEEMPEEMEEETQEEMAEETEEEMPEEMEEETLEEMAEETEEEMPEEMEEETQEEMTEETEEEMPEEMEEETQEEMAEETEEEMTEETEEEMEEGTQEEMQEEMAEETEEEMAEETEEEMQEEMTEETQEEMEEETQEETEEETEEETQEEMTEETEEETQEESEEEMQEEMTEETEEETEEEMEEETQEETEEEAEEETEEEMEEETQEETEEETEEENDEDSVVEIEEEVIEILELILYPNPTTDFITMEYGLTEVTGWKIYNMNGKILKIGTQQEIDVSSMITGMYIIVFDTPDGPLKKRFIRREF